jgi:hypothetical protein
MRVIEATTTISEDGYITLKAPPDLLPGVYPAIVVIETPDSGTPARKPFVVPVDDCGPWPEDLSLRREDMYGDDGR